MYYTFFRYLRKFNDLYCRRNWMERRGQNDILVPQANISEGANSLYRPEITNNSTCYNIIS